jgi:hypothetical protein
MRSLRRYVDAIVALAPRRYVDAIVAMAPRRMAAHIITRNIMCRAALATPDHLSA